jgi:hypothetical protein
VQVSPPNREPQPVLPLPQASAITPLTRREFYQLAEHCRDYALELARYDQTRVNLQQCHRFNQWLAQVKAYDLLAPALRTLQPARPLARWHMVSLAAVVGLILFLVLVQRTSRASSLTFFYSYGFTLLICYFVPERFYGTTIELLEGKVLRVVDALEALLVSGALGFTEAAFFQAKANLEIARRELRQQIDLAHR